MRRFVAIALSSTLILQVGPLMAAPAGPGTSAGGVRAPVATGVITGTVLSSAGQTLPNYTVRLRNIQTGQLVGTTKTDPAGRFSFPGLSPANYIVEVVNPGGAIVGSSAVVAVAAGTSDAVTVTATATTDRRRAAAAAGGGISRVLVVTTVAAAAGIAGVVMLRGDASPSR